MKWKIFLICLTASGALLQAGCNQQSYPADKLKESLTEICRTEYGIEDLDVKVVGKTIGVYLPLKQLFAADFKEAIVTGKVRNLETLFEPSPEALEKVEDVLFSISRVILSTDRDLKFYVLQATDIEKTGLQLILMGYVDDIKRVRLWDISRNEYRKRVIHELRLNHSVIWHRPVHQFFQDLEAMTSAELQKKYAGRILFTDGGSVPLLQARWRGEAGLPEIGWKVQEMKSLQVKKNEALVYAKMGPEFKGPGKHDALEPIVFLFVLSLREEEPDVMRIIPLPDRKETDILKKILFLAGLSIEENLENWEEEFPVEDIPLGPFLAQQITRRVQALISMDERIQNTFREMKLDFQYHEGAKEPSHFSLGIEASLRDFNNYSRSSLVFHEDMLYLLNHASREFVDVLRSYKFGDFDYLSLNIAHEPVERIIGREDLELFRRRKVDLEGLLSVPQF